MGTLQPSPSLLDSLTMLPVAVKADLLRHLNTVRDQHRIDLQAGAGWVELPWALARKYPNAGHEWPWQWVFPATRMYFDQTTGERRRHHLHESVLQRAVRIAALRAGIAKRVSCHTFHSKSLSALLLYCAARSVTVSRWFHLIHVRRTGEAIDS